MLCAPDLESRQSDRPVRRLADFDALRPGFGIKAKQTPPSAKRPQGCSAPRIWNQGKASGPGFRIADSMLCAPDLESRQSCPSSNTFMMSDALRPGFGIKAKHRRPCKAEPPRCSAPRIWNQGKALNPVTPGKYRMLCAPDLESRQSGTLQRLGGRRDALRPGFGIKAKQVAPRYGASGIGTGPTSGRALSGTTGFFRVCLLNKPGPRERESVLGQGDRARRANGPGHRGQRRPRTRSRFPRRASARAWVLGKHTPGARPAVWPTSPKTVEPPRIISGRLIVVRVGPAGAAMALIFVVGFWRSLLSC
jgi:hypothetical protein